MSTIITALLFGATLGIAVGPIALLIANYGLRFGAWAGVRAGLGAATADLVYALVAFTAGGVIAPLLADGRDMLEIAAALLMCGFGAWMLRGALAVLPAGDGREPVAGRPFLTTLGLTVVNPLTVLLFVGFIPHLPDTGGAGMVLAAAVSLFLGSLAMQMVFALGGAALARVLKDAAWIRRLNLLSALGIVAFGVGGLVKALG